MKFSTNTYLCALTLRLLSFPLLCFLSQASIQAGSPEADLLLKNGDQIIGHPHDIGDNRLLTFDSKHLQASAEFPLANVVSLKFDYQAPAMDAGIQARVKLRPRFQEPTGDTIQGEIKELTPESIKLSTLFGGSISLKRSMVKSLEMVNTGAGVYHGPNTIHEWVESDNAWDFSDEGLVSRSNGSIGKDLGITERAHLGFTAAWENHMRFKILLYSNSLTQKNSKAHYQVNITPSHIYMATLGHPRDGVFIPGGDRWQAIPNRPHAKKAKFDFYLDRKAGIINVYIDDTRACTLQSRQPDPTNLGSSLVFIAEERYPIKISKIVLGSWSGSLPDLRPAPNATAEVPDDKKSPHKILLANGDVIPGTVGVVEQGRMIIETEHATIKVPTEKIESLRLGGSTEDPKKYRDDIRAWFHTGGFVTLKLNKLANGKVSGYSQAMGEVSFDLNAFKRIDFHVYNREAVEIRENHGLR